MRVVVEAGSGARAGYRCTSVPCCPGVAVDGPATVVEDETTTVVPAGFRFVLDGDGHLVLDAVEAAQAAAAVAEAMAGAEVLQ